MAQLPSPNRNAGNITSIPARLTNGGCTPDGRIYVGIKLATEDGLWRDLRFILSNEDGAKLGAIVSECMKALNPQAN
jgi:hypothetical protein